MYHIEYLKKIDEVIEKGRFKDNWESLSQFKMPEWYEDSKFGIFIHWGVYSVPAAINEWYPSLMYNEKHRFGVYEYHLTNHGSLNNFGYKDFIPMFKAENFNPQQWAKLFKTAGAKYVMPVGEHHDGFQMYNSEISKYNSVQMGPKRDVLGELRNAIENEGMVFTTSSHRAEHWWYFGHGQKLESDVNDAQWKELYGPAEAPPIDPFDLYESAPDKEFLEDWLVRTCELIDKYKPKVIYFDWWIQNVAFKPYLKKFAAYYYNRGDEWGTAVAINYKTDAFPKGTAVEDFERAQLPGISPYPWQCCTTVSQKSWGYIEGDEYKNAPDILCNLIDIVSKNGIMLLNVGPKADGSIPADAERILLDIGKWMEINGEGIYGTKYWRTFGEGPTKVVEGFYNDQNREPYTSEDIRFTTKNGYLYAFVLKWPEDGTVKITSLGAKNKIFKGLIENIEILGFETKPQWLMWDEALTVKVAGIKTNNPVCLKIELM